jgi:hypothetical protein
MLRVELAAKPSETPPSPASPPGQKPAFDDLACVDAVQRVTLRLGHRPSPGQYQEVRASGVLGVLPSAAEIVTRLGDWDDAVELAELMPEPD